MIFLYCVPQRAYLGLDGWCDGVCRWCRRSLCKASHLPISGKAFKKNNLAWKFAMITKLHTCTQTTHMTAKIPLNGFRF